MIASSILPVDWFIILTSFLVWFVAFVGSLALFTTFSSHSCDIGFVAVQLRLRICGFYFCRALPFPSFGSYSLFLLILLPFWILFLFIWRMVWFTFLFGYIFYYLRYFTFYALLYYHHSYIFFILVPCDFSLCIFMVYYYYIKTKFIFGCCHLKLLLFIAAPLPYYSILSFGTSNCRFSHTTIALLLFFLLIYYYFLSFFLSYLFGGLGRDGTVWFAFGLVYLVYLLLYCLTWLPLLGFIDFIRSSTNAYYGSVQFYLHTFTFYHFNSTIPSLVLPLQSRFVFSYHAFYVPHLPRYALHLVHTFSYHFCRSFVCCWLRFVSLFLSSFRSFVLSLVCFGLDIWFTYKLIFHFYLLFLVYFLIFYFITDYLILFIPIIILLPTPYRLFLFWTRTTGLGLVSHPIPPFF